MSAMASAIILVCCCLLVLGAATVYASAVEDAPLKEYKVEIYNTLPDTVRAVCYNSWAQTANRMISARSSHNITFDLPFPWCCEFVWYNKQDSRSFFQSFLVSNAFGRVSDDPEIRCGQRCSWKLDLKGFSVFYNGLYRRLYRWSATEETDYEDGLPGSVPFDFQCNIARLKNNNTSAFASSVLEG